MTKSKRVTIKDLMEEIEKLKVKSQEVDSLRKRIADLEKDFYNLKSKNGYEFTEITPEKKVECRKCDKMFTTVNDLKKHDKSKHTQTPINCTSCESVFYKNSDLENHLEKEHNVEKIECEKCDKKFALKWRQAKDQKMHNSKYTKKCPYYNNQKSCPFEDLGCMFDHSPSGECRNGRLCKIKLCSFTHKHNETAKSYSKDDKNNLMQNDLEIEKTEEEKSFDLYVKVNFPDINSKYLENNKQIDCYYCSFKTESKILRNIEDEVYKHLKTTHEEVFNAFQKDDIEFENSWHEEFLGFFCSE